MYLDGCVKILSLGRFLFIYLFYFLYYVFIVTVQELAGSASYGVNRALISKTKKQTKIIK